MIRSSSLPVIILAALFFALPARTPALRLRSGQAADADLWRQVEVIRTALAFTARDVDAQAVSRYRPGQPAAEDRALRCAPPTR